MFVGIGQELGCTSPVVVGSGQELTYILVDTSGLCMQMWHSRRMPSNLSMIVVLPVGASVTAATSLATSPRFRSKLVGIYDSL